MLVLQRAFAKVRYPLSQILSNRIPVSWPREQTKPVHTVSAENIQTKSLARRNVFNLSIILGCSHQIEIKLERLLPIPCHTKSYKMFSSFVTTSKQEQKTYILSPLATNQSMLTHCSALPYQPSTTPLCHSVTQAYHSKKARSPPLRHLLR